jgi:hypothetical protein
MVEPNKRDFRCCNPDAAPAKGHDKVLDGACHETQKIFAQTPLMDDLNHFFNNQPTFNNATNFPV